MIPKVFLIQDYISTHSIMFRLDSDKLISMLLAGVQILCELIEHLPS